MTLDKRPESGAESNRFLFPRPRPSLCGSTPAPPITPGFSFGVNDPRNDLQDAVERRQQQQFPALDGEVPLDQDQVPAHESPAVPGHGTLQVP